MAVYVDDKRLISDSAEYWVNRVSVHDWSYCKYCYRDTPQFLFSEGSLRIDGTRSDAALLLGVRERSGSRVRPSQFAQPEGSREMPRRYHQFDGGRAR